LSAAPVVVRGCGQRPWQQRRRSTVGVRVVDAAPPMPSGASTTHRQAHDRQRADEGAASQIDD